MSLCVGVGIIVCFCASFYLQTPFSIIGKHIITKIHKCNVRTLSYRIKRPPPKQRYEQYANNSTAKLFRSRGYWWPHGLRHSTGAQASASCGTSMENFPSLGKCDEESMCRCRFECVHSWCARIVKNFGIFVVAVYFYVFFFVVFR